MNLPIDKLLEKLYSLRLDYTTKDLERITKLTKFLNNPHQDYPIIHIAGTNGKGSICSLLSSVLQESGYKVGLYTSPHILKFNERIKINGKYIEDESIANIYDNFADLSDEINASFFDITTAIAFKYFSDKKVDIAIIETGLGGRLDSTNIVNPILSIITNISTDHTEQLGKNILDIAKEKAGIIKKNVPVIVQDTNPHIIEVLLKKANEMQTTLYVNYDFPFIEFKEYDYVNNKMIYFLDDVGITKFRTNKDFLLNIESNKGIIFPMKVSPLLGQHQLSNIKLLIFATLIVHLSGFYIKKSCIDKGIKNVIKNTGLMGRIKNISKTDKPIILDVAHNKASVRALASTLKEMYPDRKWNIVFGVMKDKDIKQMLKELLPICEKLIIMPLKVERAANSDTIHKIALELGFNDIIIEDNIYSVCKKIKSSNEIYAICGTFFIIEEVIKAFQLEGNFLK